VGDNAWQCTSKQEEKRRGEGLVRTTQAEERRGKAFHGTQAKRGRDGETNTKTNGGEKSRDRRGLPDSSVAAC